MTDLYAAFLASAPMRRWLAVRSRCARWLYGTPGVRDVIAKMTRGPE